MDRVVLDAYGWRDLQPTCEFQVLHEDDEADTDDGGTTSRRKKPWRYRWPDAVRDEVLSRLLKANAAQAETERQSGLLAAPEAKLAAKPKARSATKPKASSKARKSSKSPGPVTGELGLLLPPKEK